MGSWGLKAHWLDNSQSLCLDWSVPALEPIDTKGPIPKLPSNLLWRLIWTQKDISHYVFQTWNILQVKFIRRQLRHSPLLACIQLRLGKDVGEGIIVSPRCEWVPSESVAELFTDCPPECKKFQTMDRIDALYSTQGSACKSDGSGLVLSLWDLW